MSTPKTIKETIYTLFGTINEVPFNTKTSDIEKTLLELKPEFVFTDTYLTLQLGVGKNKITTERKLNLTQGKKLFLDENFRKVFILNLMVEFS